MLAHALVLFFVQVMSYLIGSIPFGYLVANFHSGIDIREHGSGNIGATNVGRTLGMVWGIVVFALDFLKGAIPVAFASYIQLHQVGGLRFEDYYYLPELAGFAAILGHLFPIYLGFRGGKGVATSMGVLLFLAPKPVLIGLGAWLILVSLTRMVSVGSIGFALTFLAAYWWLAFDPWSKAQLAMTLFAIVATLLIVVRHRENVGRILNGTESRIRLPWGRARDSNGETHLGISRTEVRAGPDRVEKEEEFR